MFIYSANTYGHLPLKWPELSVVSEGDTVESPNHCLLCLAFPPLEERSWEYSQSPESAPVTDGGTATWAKV